jgi:predicted nucleotidyltransferase
MFVESIHLPVEAIAELCRKYGVEELSVFGSALRQDLSLESDVDFLVVFKNDDYGPWMARLTGLEEDLSRLVGRKADLVPKRDLKWVIRDRVLSSAQVIYVDAKRRPAPG